MTKLKIDNPFFSAMSRIGDLILLNLIFIVTCIPVITIGAAMTSLNKIALKIARNECNYVIREYLDVFKKEWKPSVCLWIIFLLTGAVLVFDLIYVKNIHFLVEIGVGAVLVLWLFDFSYAFWLQAQFVNTIRNTLKNSLYMAIRHFPYTILIILVNCIPVICFWAGPGIMSLAVMIYLLVGFAVAARVNAGMFCKIFDRYMDTWE